MHHQRFLVAATLALAGSWCAAQTVYRCGNSYGTEPCPGGHAVAIPAPGPAGTQESQAMWAARAVKAAEADARRADAMEKARLAQEKDAPRAIVIGPAQPPLPAASAGSPAGNRTNKPNKAGKAAKPELFTAVAPGSARPKKK